MSDITIPPEAVEAAEKIIADAFPALHLTQDEYTQVVRAACRAMLRSWPGMFEDGARIDDNEQKFIILPLPKEPSE